MKVFSDYCFPEIKLSEKQHMQATASSFEFWELRLIYTVLTTTGNQNKYTIKSFKLYEYKQMFLLQTLK